MVFPGLHGMMQTRRNPKVDFEELLLPLQQDPAICASRPGAPLHPPAVITKQKTILILAIIATSHTTPNDPLVRSSAQKCPLKFVSADARGPVITAIPPLIRRCQAGSSSGDRHKPPAMPSTILMMQLL